MIYQSPYGYSINIPDNFYWDCTDDELQKYLEDIHNQKIGTEEEEDEE